MRKVYMICNAYESGFGHGLNNDGLNGDYYSDSELNEAYKIGYEAGQDARNELDMELKENNEKARRN